MRSPKSDLIFSVIAEIRGLMMSRGSDGADIVR
jgi:hypothetical protein